MADLLTIAQLESDMDFAHIQDLRTSILLSGGDLDEYQSALEKDRGTRVLGITLSKALLDIVAVFMRDRRWHWETKNNRSSAPGFETESDAWGNYAEFLQVEIKKL